MRYQLYPHIIADPDIQGGKPVIEGTSVPASLLIEQVAAGKSLDDVAREQGVGVEDVRAALGYGAMRVEESVPLRASSAPVPPLDDESIAAAEEEAKRLGLDPKTLSPLGRQLLAIRAQIVASGEPLLTWEEIEAEVAERRGERPEDYEA